MAKSPEVEHLEKAIQAARKVIEHLPLASIEESQTEAETPEPGPEAA
jgi:hypothetical protein